MESVGLYFAAKYRTKIVGNGENPDDWAKKG
jgi:hypothetical protein